jgi:hypothetical protein
MPTGHPSSWRLKKARFDVYDRFMGVDLPPFQHGGSSDNQKLLDAFNRGDWKYIRKWLTKKYWTEKEQGSPDYVGGIDMSVVLASWRVYPQLRPEIMPWLEGWAYLTKTFWSPKRNDIAMPAARSFMNFYSWTDCYRMLVLGEKVRRRISMKRAREKNNPLYLATEICRELAGSRLPGYKYIKPSKKGLKLKYRITRIEFSGGRSISYAALESNNDNDVVTRDDNVYRKDGIIRAGTEGNCYGAPARIEERDRGIYWNQAGQSGLVEWPRGHRGRTVVIGA